MIQLEIYFLSKFKKKNNVQIDFALTYRYVCKINLLQTYQKNIYSKMGGQVTNVCYCILQGSQNKY